MFYTFLYLVINNSCEHSHSLLIRADWSMETHKLVSLRSYPMPRFDLEFSTLESGLQGRWC